MKFIHCGDIHLESPMRRNLPPEKARERKHEILLTFERMVQYAAQHQVDGILICGDLFDTRTICVQTRKILQSCIMDYPNITFYYLKGNHDEVQVFEGQDIPGNLKLFSNEWTSYQQEDVTISGLELNQSNSRTAADALLLDPNHVNLVMLHGQTTEYQSKDKAETINLNDFRNRNIDYLALGHIHSYKIEELDRRGKYAYCGCLEGRGYDECGEKGFLLLTVEDHKVSQQFIPFALRQVYHVFVDITDDYDNQQVAEQIENQVQDISSKSLVKVTLTGRVPVESIRSLDYLTQKFQNRFYSFKIKDETGILLDMDQIKHDISLKGEYIRLVSSQVSEQQTQRELIEMGMRALTGEEIFS